MNKTFSVWIDTVLEEKGISQDTPIEVEGDFGINYMTVENVVDVMKQTTANEQKAIKDMLVKIDYANGDVMHYITHLAGAIAI